MASIVVDLTAPPDAALFAVCDATLTAASVGHPERTTSFTVRVTIGLGVEP